MICPYCEHSFPLTWRRYWLRVPFGSYSCPSCGGKSKLSTGLVYWLLYLPLAAISPLVAIVLGALVYASVSPQHAAQRIDLFFESWWPYAAIAMLWLLFFPLDRIVDERFRRLRRSKRGKDAV